MSSTFPGSPSDWGDEMDALTRLVASRRLGVLTGAGVSTDSGIPDYRGQGSLRRNPMSIDQFLVDERYRKRYWAGSHRGWSTFARAQPNPGHRALAALESAGVVGGIVTQNVDGLHRRAGSRHVIDLHGALDRAVCLTCRQRYDRGSLAQRLSRENPWLDLTEPTQLAPDGDVAVDKFDDVVVPSCDVCGGILKPDVVFFGEVVPASVFDAASALVRQSEVVLVAGSSLAVNSGFRLVTLAKKHRIPVVVINRGPTKADPVAEIRIDAGTSEVLTELVNRLGVGDLDEDIE